MKARPIGEDAVAGALLGTAVGDALGLPREGLSRARARRIHGDELRHGFLFGRGMVSDDTEHTCMLAQAWLASDGSPERFARSFAWRLRGWLLGLPAGVGMGTARATLKLWIGFPPHRSGVFSAGNGPAMRTALLGLCIEDAHELRTWVDAATRVTHTDPRASRAALLVALAARHGATRGPEGVDAAAYLDEARAALDEVDDELAELLDALRAGLGRGDPVAKYADGLGQERGVSGYAYRTVPIALYGFLAQPGDFRGAVSSVIELGGDADTTGAIVGAMSGATVGAAGMPRDWIDGVRDAPRSVAWMRRLAARVAASRNGASPGPLPLAWPLILPRNVAFLAVVLAHGFRRLAPPY